MGLPPHGVKYAVHVITLHFGNLVSKVCECLLRKGPLRLADIKRHITDLSSLQVDNSLLVMIHHNCVQSFSLEESNGKVNTHYMVLFDNIIYRVRFPKFLPIVLSELDRPHTLLFREILAKGRCTLQELASSGDAEKSNAEKERLKKLVMARFVERCPKIEPFLPLPTDEEEAAAAKKKRGSKSAKTFQEPETLEQRVLAAAKQMDAKRFLFETSDAQDYDGDESKNISRGIHVGEKRNHDVMESGLDDAKTDEEVIYWRANFEEFIRHFRHKACVEIVREWTDDGTAKILRAMLEASRDKEDKVKVKSSAPLLLNSIYEEVIKSSEGRIMTFEHVRASLVQLVSPLQFIKLFDEAYSIEFSNVFEVARSEEAESIVQRRYGTDACKIFRVLSKSNCFLETDKISDMVFVEKKEAAKILYKMWQDEYLLMEKIVVGTSSFLLWKVDKQRVREHVLDEMFHAAMNLSIRLEHELEKNKEIANLPQEKQDGPMKDTFQKFQKVRELLESSQVRLDDSIMLFHDL